MKSFPFLPHDKNCTAQQKKTLLTMTIYKRHYARSTERCLSGLNKHEALRGFHATLKCFLSLMQFRLKHLRSPGCCAKRWGGKQKSQTIIQHETSKANIEPRIIHNNNDPKTSRSGKAEAFLPFSEELPS